MQPEEEGQQGGAATPPLGGEPGAQPPDAVEETPPQTTPTPPAADPGATSQAPGATTEVAVDAPDPGPSADWTAWGLAGGLSLAFALLVVVVTLRTGGKVAPPPPMLEERLPVGVGIEPARERELARREEAPPPGLAARLRDQMSRTREALQARIDDVFGRQRVDEGLLDELEEVLLLADVGVPTTQRILDPLREHMRAGERDPAVLRVQLREQVRGLLGAVAAPFAVGGDPFVLLVVGVNGSGKTTTIGKLAARLAGEGHKVLLAAGDTYRAAAADQLAVWAERAGAEIVRHQEGSDPSAVVFDALDAARARGADVVIIDTAGRLQTRRDLMEELTKVRRVIQKKVPAGPHETLLVIDGTMGQNAMSQAQRFHEATPLSGVVITKLDGTAKGGMVLAIAAELGLPVKFIGIGEKVEDLRPFEVDAFVDTLV